nr:hypothetical protein RPNZKVPU_RPNZKVPU_CDS_0004 [Microvirus sp.]
MIQSKQKRTWALNPSPIKGISVHKSVPSTIRREPMLTRGNISYIGKIDSTGKVIISAKHKQISLPAIDGINVHVTAVKGTASIRVSHQLSVTRAKTGKIIDHVTSSKSLLHNKAFLGLWSSPLLLTLL